MKGRSSRSSGFSVRDDSLHSGDFNANESNFNVWDAMTDDVSEKTVEMERLKAEYIKDVAFTISQTAEKMQKLNDRARQMNQVIYMDRLQFAKKRTQHKNDVTALHNVLEADPEVRAEMARLRADCDAMLETAASVHREFYHYERLFNTADILQKMSELTYQTMSLEETLKMNEQPMKDSITYENAVKGILSLGHGREQDSKELADRLRTFNANRTQ